jgi:O-antigen/teichoic acid export membrane protein
MIKKPSPARGLIKNPRKLITELPHFLLSNEGDLKKKVIRGGFWVFSLRILDRAFQFIRTIILARLLAPEDFGLMGIALLAMSALESFSQTGVLQALIQKNENVENYLDTAWTIQVIRGTAIALILFFGAPLVGTFFGEPNAIPLTRALALSELFKGLTHIGVVYFQKDLEFKKQFAYQISGTITDLLISIPVALLLRNPWALIIGSVAGNFIRLIFSFIVSSRPLSFKLNKKYSKHLYNFGKYIFLQSIILFLLTQGDDAFVGKYLGTAALGIYQLAYLISNITATEFTHVISSITFPAYSKIQHKPNSLIKALKMTLGFTALITFPVAGGIFILAPEFTQLFLGNQWLGAVSIIQILSLEGLLRSLAASFGSIYQATANLKAAVAVSSTQLLFFVLIIAPFSFYWGLEGTAVAATVMLIIGFIFASIKISQILKTNIFKFYKNYIPSLFSTLIMIGFIYLLKKTIITNINFFSLMVLIFGGVLLYTLSILIYFLKIDKGSFFTGFIEKIINKKNERFIKTTNSK